MTSTGQRFLEWASNEPTITLVTLMGSRARAADGPDGADVHSDWDFQVATTDQAAFATDGWTLAFADAPITYVKRLGTTGVVDKVTAVFPDGELDWVIIPADGLQLLAQMVAGGGAADPNVAGMLVELGKVLQGGYRVEKGAEEFDALFAAAAEAGAGGLRLDDDAVATLANGFVCDYISTRRKIARGEYLAAQRWLHVLLMETLFSLVFELRSREGLPVKPEARRLESLADPRLPLLAIAPNLEAASLRQATEDAAHALRVMVESLVGDRWQWPDLSPLGLDD